MADFSNMAVVIAIVEDVPILFLVNQHGVAEVLVFRLGLRFHFKPQSIHVDEEIFLSESG